MTTLEKLHLGMTREEVTQALGIPDETSHGTRKYPTPGVYKYGKLELHFTPWKTGTLWLIMDAETHRIIAKR